MKLRPYQEKLVSECVTHMAAGRRVLLQAPVGSGKTNMALEIVHRLAPKSFTWVAHTNELLEQAKVRAKEMGLDACMAARTPVVAANGYFAQWRSRLTVIDEAHRSRAKSYEKIVANSDALLGLSASPMRTDGKPLVGPGAPYDVAVLGPTVVELAEMESLMIPEVFTSPTHTVRVSTTMGEYNMVDAARKLNTRTINGDLVRHWLAEGRGRPTLVFACTSTHADSIADRFRAAGIGARAVYAKSLTRREDVAAFVAGEYQVCVNVMIASEGFDFPACGVVVMARPTKSRILYVQMIGRCMRAHPGKERPTVLDHAGNWHEHGDFAADFDWLKPHIGTAQNTSESGGGDIIGEITIIENTTLLQRVIRGVIQRQAPVPRGI